MRGGAGSFPACDAAAAAAVAGADPSCIVYDPEGGLCIYPPDRPASGSLAWTEAGRYVRLSGMQFVGCMLAEAGLLVFSALAEAGLLEGFGCAEAGL